MCYQNVLCMYHQNKKKLQNSGASTLFKIFNNLSFEKSYKE